MHQIRYYFCIYKICVECVCKSEKERETDREQDI